jgi:hypothetical protein
MHSDEIARAVSLIREAGALLIAAKAEASRTGDDEDLGKVNESLETTQAMIRDLEGLLVLEVDRPSPDEG